MKKFFIIVVILFVYTCNLEAQTYISMRPNWTFNPPQAENSTYEYYVSRGVGNTEKEARKDAFVLAVKEAQARVGVGSNSTEIFKAFQTSDGDFNVIASAYEIPMKEVCYFSEKTLDNNQWYYYQLLQVAISGNITPDFRQFSGDCYDFSKAKELQEILGEENKKLLDAQKRNARQKLLEAYKQYDISYSEFCYDINKFQDLPTTGYLLTKSNKIKEVGHYLWTLPPFTALGVGAGVGLGLGESDPGLACAIIFPTIVASALPSIICYSIASGYKKKAWKAYRKPYDDAVRDLQGKEMRISLRFSPSVGHNWAGVGMQMSF